MPIDLTLFVSELFSHPFIILLLGGLAGKIYFLPRILKDRSIGYKLETVRRILEVRKLINEIEFIYDRTVNTIQDVVKNGRTIPRDLVRTEINRISNLLNEKLPLYKKDIDTEIEVYFSNDDTVLESYEEFDKSLNKIHEFIHNMPNWPSVFTSKFSSVEDIKKSDLRQKEKELIKSIQKARTIHLLFK